jgi:very-short-patch-repair endonuclease
MKDNLKYVLVPWPRKGREHLMQKTLIEEQFRHYVEELLYTRKDFTSKLGLNHRYFTAGLRAYYSPEEVEELRRKKLVSSNIHCRVRTWEQKLSDIEPFYPGFTKIFQDNIKENPELVMKALIDLNDMFYKVKQAIKPIKKYANQSLSRQGKARMNFVANGLEARVKFALDELGIEYQPAFGIGNRRFDFRVGHTLIEVDGGQYHELGNKRDKVKEKLAKKAGYKILRLDEKLVKSQPLKLRRCLNQLK